MASLDPESLLALERISEERHYPKGSYLLEAGSICRHSYLMLQGTARKYYLHEGKEITTEFYFEEDIAASFQSYALQEPSEEYIEALEDCRVSLTNYQKYQLLKQQNPKILALDLLLVEYYALLMEEHLYRERIMDATERYQYLLSKNKEIVQKMKVGHIASYLGVSFETLSRIRRKLSD